jgi:hypothetical protein
MAMYGASFQARIVTKVALAVLNLFLRGDNPAHFCDTEADARVWLEGRRRLLAAESGG